MRNQTPRSLPRFGLAIALAALVTVPALAEQVDIVSVADNTLIERADGSLSNGSGNHGFAGQTLQNPGEAIRRMLVRFDVASSVPAGAIIDSATLELHVSLTRGPDHTQTLFRTLEDWGEAASFGFRGEGIGAAAQPDDATWLHAFFPGTLWSTPGGAFSTTPSASTMIMGNGTYAFTSAQLVADVQSMLDDPANDFGWGVLGDELASNPIVRRYDTRENPTASFRPTLRVEYSMPAPVPATGIWASVALLAALLVLGWRFARTR